MNKGYVLPLYLACPKHHIFKKGVLVHHLICIHTHFLLCLWLTFLFWPLLMHVMVHKINIWWTMIYLHAYSTNHTSQQARPCNYNLIHLNDLSIYLIHIKSRLSVIHIVMCIVTKFLGWWDWGMLNLLVSGTGTMFPGRRTCHGSTFPLINTN